MRVVIKSKKTENGITFGAEPVEDKHVERKIKKLARNRFRQRQVNMPDGE